MRAERTLLPMIDVNISSPGYDLDDSLREFVANSFAGLDEFMDKL